MTINVVCVIRKSLPVRSTKSSKVTSITAHGRVRGISLLAATGLRRQFLDLLRNKPEVGSVRHKSDKAEKFTP
jgi:hypothetical protein